MKKTVPSLYISHGSPTFAIEPASLGPQLTQLGQTLHADYDIKAILVVSPHWQTLPGKRVAVMHTPQPETIYDFGGFPAELYTLKYPAQGNPAAAAQTLACLAAAGYETHIETQRGLDHGAWVPLRFLFPQANIPVFQISMPYDLTAHAAYALGQALKPLREQGIMILGSGSTTHNLSEFRQPQPKTAQALAFAAWINEKVMAGNVAALLQYRSLAPHAVWAHPTDEHLLPLFVALGAAKTDRKSVV